MVKARGRRAAAGVRWRGGLALALILAASLALPPAAGACGTVSGWVYTYQQGQRHKALFHMLDCASSYKPHQDDPALLNVVADAFQRDPELAELGLSVFKFYNCLYGARNQPGYAQVLATAQTRDGHISLKKYRDWFVVTAPSGAYLRQGPDAKTKALTAMPLGLLVRRLGQSGDWVKVKPVGPGSVDPRFERVIGFVHSSLLAPY